MESKKYITSKSKTFKEGSELGDIGHWVINNMDREPSKIFYKTKQKYKITITNLK